MYGRMPHAPRSEVLAAIDCARCRSLVAGHAPDPVVIPSARVADLGTGVAYAIAKHYGSTTSSASRDQCPDCGRRVSIQQMHNDYSSLMPLDRDVVGR